MPAAALPRPPLLPARADVGSAARALLLTGVLAVGAAGVIVLRPDLLRLLCAGVVAMALVSLVLSRPRAGVLATIAFLVVLALVRRLLIADAGWSGADPLVLVGPTVVVALMVRLFVLERRRLAPDRLSRLVTFVLGLTVVQVLNPAGGGPLAGMAGLLAVGIPLLWFYVGRELGGERLTGGLLQLVLVLGVGVAAYGLVQTELGFPAWDMDWFVVTGYDALNVGDDLRPFGPFSSSAEYALFLGSAIAIAVGFMLRGRATAVVALPALALALFLASTRGALITTFACVIVLAAVNTGRPRTALVVGVTTLALAVGALAALGPALGRSADNSGSDLVSHQVGGVTDPLNPGESTLLLHLEMVVDGIGKGIAAPLGHGPGVTSQFGAKFGAEGKATEVDMSNAFVSLGLLGGFAYLALVGLAVATALKLALRGHRLMLPVLGVLLVGLGQWLMGGHYALAPITWLLLGYVAREAHR